MRGSAFLVLGVLAVGGCGGGSSPAKLLDCDWLAGNNCYKTTVAAAGACLPSIVETGTLSANNSTCTYASGAVVTFNPPLTLPLPQSPNWAFTVTKNGTPCLTYTQPAQGTITLKTSAGTFTEGAAGSSITATCPDGTQYSNSNPLSLLSCGADAGFLAGGLPGSTWSSTNVTVSFSLVGVPTNNTSTFIFDCGK
jgi:hypothetical protein